MSLKLLNSRDVEGRFYELLEHRSIPGWVDKITWLNRTNKEEEIYKFLGHAPRMSKFAGRREAEKPTIRGIRIKNDVYDASMEIQKDEWRRDMTGQIDIRIQELADEPASHWTELVTDIIEKGSTDTSEYGLAYDDQKFYDTDHAWDDSGIHSNALTIDVVDQDDPTPAEIKKVILQGIQKAKTFKDNKGRPINKMAMSWVVMIPTNMWANAVEAFGSPILYNGTAPVTNTLQAVMASGMQIELVENNWSTTTNKIRLFRADGRVAPFIRQIEVPVEMISLGRESEYFKLNRHALFSIEGVHGIGFGYWQYSVEITLNTA